MSKFKFMHTLSESKGIFAIEQKAIVSCLVKNVAFLLQQIVIKYYCLTKISIRSSVNFPADFVCLWNPVPF